MEILARPKGREDRGPEIWVDEAIWGHRLHDEQTPWLTFLEFLGVFYAENKKGKGLIETELNALSYRPQHQLRLRNLLFSNPMIAQIKKKQTSDESKWEQWFELMRQTAGGLENPDFRYLKNHFSSFDDFCAIIDFLQTSAIEGKSNKRWSSKFVFPFGGAALYEDLNFRASGSGTNDRRFFARTGELLYLMLCRSRVSGELQRLLADRLLAAGSQYDKLIGILQGEPDLAATERAGSYLPEGQSPSFDRLGQDWVSILECKMPPYDAIPHLVTMAGLNLVLYQLERAQEAVGDGQAVQLVWEIVGPKRSKVRALSEKSFQANNSLPILAVESYIASVRRTEEWDAACQAVDPIEAAKELMSKRYDWPEEEELEGEIAAPDDLIERLKSRARVRHAQHVGKFHATWSRLIGMSSRRSARSTRYSPTDHLLKTLVVCCVDKRQEFGAFLEDIAKRYHIIIGEHQATSWIESGGADCEDFAENSRRLEERLASLGLLERFSDSCAYVVNPFERSR